MRAITLATKGMIVPTRPFISGGIGGRIRTECESKPLIKVNKVKYTNGVDEKEEVILITDVKLI